MQTPPLSTIELPYPFDRRWTIGQAVELACLLEASAAKVGNVHPGASFSDMHFSHFLASAVAIGPIFAQDNQRSVGNLVLESVRATRSCVGRNTNLGTLLLFAPLAKAHAARLEHARDPSTARLSTVQLSTTRLACNDLKAHLTRVLEQLTPEDCQDVYSAICTAAPGGLGSRAEDDVTGKAPDDLRTAMATVADVDAVARQYVNNFDDIFTRMVPWLQQELISTGQPLEAVCRVQLRWLAYEADGLIVRKAGMQVATQVQQRAQRIVQTFDSPNVARRSAAELPLSQQPQLQDLDQFLRADGHRRNPGTTADLIAAALLVLLLARPES